MKKFIIIFISLLLLTVSLSAKIITVTSGADNGTGTLREAITNAEANDTIVFADNVTIVTLTNYGFNLDKNITIIGNEENNTVITCNGRHFTMPELTEPITVYFNNLILKNGYATQCGGAIFNRTGNTLTLTNCAFINNRANTTCGAVDNAGKLTINNCIFENNSIISTSGVGAVLNGGEMFINNSIFIGNKGVSAGAVYNYPESIISIIGCTFKENKGVVASAFRNRGTAMVVNSLFIFNEHNLDNTNIIYDRSGTISTYTSFENERETIFLIGINSTIADNTDDVGVYIDAQVTLQNNIIWNNNTNDVYTSNYGTVTASYNLIGTSNIDLSGNGNIIGANPLFVGNGNYSLQEGSPAIDKGNNSYISATITKDLAGNSRISNSTVDMGAYEYQAAVTYYTLTFAGEEINIEPQTIEENNHAIAPEVPERTGYDFEGWFTDNDTFLNEWNFETDIVTQDTTLYAKWTKTSGITEFEKASMKVYPNPTSGQLRITNYELNSDTKIEIFDVMGRKQKAESRREKAETVLDISHLSAGVYFLWVNGQMVKVVKEQ